MTHRRVSYPLIILRLMLLMMIGFGAFLGIGLTNEDDRDNMLQQFVQIRSNIETNGPTAIAVLTETAEQTESLAVYWWREALREGAALWRTSQQLPEQIARLVPAIQKATPAWIMPFLMWIVKFIEILFIVLATILVAAMFLSPTLAVLQRGRTSRPPRLSS